MKFALKATEMSDWMECWCFRCKHDHLWSHFPHDEEGDGCDLILRSIVGKDVPEFTPHGETWWRTIPAGVVCSRFERCEAPECQDPSDAERRGGETRAEFHDRLRAETIAEPEVAE